MDDPQWTRRDPGVTSRDAPGPAAGGGGPLVRLPGVLAGRFEVEDELPVQGAESDLLLVREGATRYVVKIYRRGYRADPAVWEQVPRLRSPHIVRVLETGHADGRDYEIMEYLPEGSLRSLARARQVDPTAVVGQLAEGLKVLHDAGIVHRDLKPENVLVRGADLVITDFGLSRVLEQSVVFASSSRTLAYAAPESLSGQVSPARDWWSLGMIAREVVTGKAPFDGMSETVVVDHLATRPIDNGDIQDPHLRLLCRGLLTRDPRRRWGHTEVAAWLRGGTPEVHDEQPPPVRRPAETPAPVPPQTRVAPPLPGRQEAEEAYRAEGRLALWEQKERARKAGAGRARLRAALWTLPILALWVGGSFVLEMLFGGEPDRVQAAGSVQKMPVPLGLLVTASVAAWAVSLVVELVLASQQGGDYLADGPWATAARISRLTGGGLSKTSRAMSATAQRTGARGCGLALLAATIPLLLALLLLSLLSALAWMLWMLALTAGALAHIGNGGIRMHRWRQANSSRRAEVIED
ncbi:serine/threonine protein kinase [Actinocorallia herbida]|uniref:Serine/threonine protein kinase n=1 Tax=Actinocorallia herbida TaxID=58109 RepID=A0A3N1CNE8_9ACTN|nr:serine/threonine-protein kinase [Actinocorallia herbida]ROO82847.1 serine/threonine protein kinase [Actinocorallia herbida]